VTAADYSWDPATRDPAMIPTDRCHPDYHDFRIGFARCLRCPEPNPDFDPDFDPWSAA
jgi:hypothetical protein